jgi:two-component system cell cycle sensor histidine kinase/response regulator CckA
MTPVLLDVTSPFMNGEEAFQEIRRVKNDARVNLCSEYDEQEITNRFVDNGSSGFIQKSCFYKLLIREVREVLGN